MRADPAGRGSFAERTERGFAAVTVDQIVEAAGVSLESWVRLDDEDLLPLTIRTLAALPQAG